MTIITPKIENEWNTKITIGHVALIEIIPEERLKVLINHQTVRDGNLMATALALSCENLNITLVKFLLDHGADPFIEDWEGMNAFHLLVMAPANGEYDCDDPNDDTPVSQPDAKLKIMDLLLKSLKR